MTLSAQAILALQSNTTGTTRATRPAAELKGEAGADLRKRPRHRDVFGGHLRLLIALTVAMACGVAHAQSLVATVPAGTGPVAVAVNQTTNMVYVADNTVKTLLVIDGATNTATTIQAGGPFGDVAVNPTTNTI
jgi:DNA-binding beta-propeller fold protein YncE